MLTSFRQLCSAVKMAGDSPTIILDNKLRSACLDGRLKTIIAIVESQSDTTMNPYIFSTMMTHAACHNHVDVVSYCLSKGGTVTEDVLDGIVAGLSFETHKLLVDIGAADIE